MIWVNTLRSYCVAAEARPASAVAILVDISSIVRVLTLAAYVPHAACHRMPGGKLILKPRPPRLSGSGVGEIWAIARAPS